MDGSNIINSGILALHTAHLALMIFFFFKSFHCEFVPANTQVVENREGRGKGGGRTVDAGPGGDDSEMPLFWESRLKRS